MSLSPISFVAVNYRDYPTYWFKAYQPGTTTPLALSLDAVGSTYVSKLQLNADGFLNTTGGALVTPYIDEAYDAWLFPTEAEADANDTSNAIRVADDITGINVESALINDLSQAYTFPTVALMKASLIVFPVGKKIFWQGYYAESDGGSNWGIVTSGAHTEDGGSIFTLDDGKYVKANLKGKKLNVRKFGTKNNGVDTDSLAIQACIDLVELCGGGTVFFPKVDVSAGEFYAITTPLVIKQIGMTMQGESKIASSLRKIDNTSTGDVVTTNGVDYTFNTPCVFQITHQDTAETQNTVVRQFRCENMEIRGNDDDAQVAFDAPGIAYATFYNLETRFFRYALQSLLTSFVVHFEDWRSNDCKFAHWDIYAGPYWTFINCYANGAPSGGVGIRTQDSKNVTIINCQSDTLATGFEFRGSTVAAIYGGGTEARLNLVRASGTSKVIVNGGMWTPTIISSQDNNPSAVFRADDSATIKAYSPTVGLYNFGIAPDLSVKRAAYSTGSGSSITVVDPLFLEASSIVVAYDLSDFTAVNNGSYVAVEQNNIITKSINNSVNHMFNNGFIDKKRSSLVKDLKIQGGVVSTVLLTSSALGYGGSISGFLTLDFIGVNGAKALIGGMKSRFMASSRNSNKVVFSEIYKDIDGIDASINITLLGSIDLSGVLTISIVPSDAALGEVLVGVAINWQAKSSSGVYKSILMA